MFNYTVNFSKVVKDNLPDLLRTTIRLRRIRAMLKPLKQMYGEFMVLKAEYQYKCTFNGQVIYLETALNDSFDPVNRAIFITSAFFPPVYIYGKSELKQAIRIYSKWNSATAYLSGQFVWYNGLVYQANTNNTNKTPGVDPEWTITTDKAPIIRSASNYNGAVSFIVNVPSALTFSTAQMNSLITYYIFAGFGYQIKTF